MTDNANLEVYIYQGNEGEKVPKTVEKLIVEEGVQVLPEGLFSHCRRLRQVTLPNGLTKIGDYAFAGCFLLFEITICSTIQFIGKGAFCYSQSMKKIEFEFSPTSSHQLQTIGERAFEESPNLQRISLPFSVTAVGGHAFFECRNLLEANLSTTCLSEIPEAAFFHCRLLQTVNMPNTVEYIGERTFRDCLELVTVVIPLDSPPIRIGKEAFLFCRKLANVALPVGSTAEESQVRAETEDGREINLADSFDCCNVLNERYGEGSDRVVKGLTRRFAGFAVHEMCYDHSRVAIQDFRQCIADQPEGTALVDGFGMTPFHVLFSTIEPPAELLEILLDSLPKEILLKCRDVNGKRPLDYLIHNWTNMAQSLMEMTLQKWMIDPLERWGAMSWLEDTRQKVHDILAEDDKEERIRLCDQACSALEHYENLETTSILELALWKGKFKSWSDGTKRQTLDREDCRCLSGSDVVIPQVTSFLLV